MLMGIEVEVRFSISTGRVLALFQQIYQYIVKLSLSMYLDLIIQLIFFGNGLINYQNLTVKLNLCLGIK